jgi:hypothetical protein
MFDLSAGKSAVALAKEDQSVTKVGQTFLSAIKFAVRKVGQTS